MALLTARRQHEASTVQTTRRPAGEAARRAGSSRAACDRGEHGSHRRGKEACNESSSFRAARLLRNVGREEAGKFLILIDAYRSPASDQAALSRQFGRAKDHLSKLVYAQVADYSIGSQSEMLSAVAKHRQALYLEGWNGYEEILRNELLMERESAMYTDLVDIDGELGWWEPS